MHIQAMLCSAWEKRLLRKASIILLSRCMLQAMKLRQAKNELERKVQDQEEELDEQAGTIQQLEQVFMLDFAVFITYFLI